MAKRNSSVRANERDRFLLAFIMPEVENERIAATPVTPEYIAQSEDAFKQEMKDFDEAIDDCKNMLLYSLDMQNKKEIAFWRKMLQQTKTDKRLRRNEYYNGKELAVV